MNREEKQKSERRFHIVYAVGRVEAWLQEYAISNRLHPFELIERVATILHSKGQGSENPMSLSQLRSDTSQPRGTVESLEVDERAHVHGPQRPKGPGTRRISAAGLKKIARVQKERWAKIHAEAKAKEPKAKMKYGKNNPHWTQLPKNKKKIRNVLALMRKRKTMMQKTAKAA